MKLPKNEYRISITSGCNMKCVYCHNEGNRYSVILNLDSIENLIQNSYGLGLEGVRLTGGEPTIHPEFLNICKMLKEKYNLKVGVNTNCIEFDKLMLGVKMGWIDRITVGIDYIDGFVSKNSPVGISSREILTNIIKLKDLGVNISIATVYTNEFDNTLALLKWGLNNGIIVKIIEVVKNEIADNTSSEFLEMRTKIFAEFNLLPELDIFNQVIGKNNNGDTIVKFFHSHCRLRECDICKNLHLRVTSKGKLKHCLFVTVQSRR